MGIKTIFLGTPEIAAEILKTLKGIKEIDITSVITNPDKKQDRSLKIFPSKVKEMAEKLGISCFTPETSQKLSEIFKKLDFDLAIVVAYGRIIKDEDLVIPKFGFVNLHFSLLPLLRGPSPIQSALLEGFNKTGVSIFKLVKKVDAGDIIAQQEVKIDTKDNANILTEKLILNSKELLRISLPQYLAGKLELKKQDEEKATFTNKIEKIDGKIDAKNDGSQKIINKIRAFYSWPQVYFEIDSKRFKLIEAEISDFNEIKEGELKIVGKNIFLGTIDAPLLLKKIQPENKKILSAAELISGYAYLNGKKIS